MEGCNTVSNVDARRCEDKELEDDCANMVSELCKKAVEVLQSSSGNPEGYFLKGLAKASEGSWEDAVELYDTALVLCRTRRAELEKEYDGEEPTWDNLLEMSGGREWELSEIGRLEAKIRVQLAKAYDESGEKARALETLVEAVSSNPESVSLRCYLALLYQDRGMAADAVQQCEEAAQHLAECSEEDIALFQEVAMNVR